MDFNKSFADALEKLQRTASLALTKSLEILNLTINGIVTLLSALKVKLDETLETRKEAETPFLAKAGGGYTFLAQREGSNVSTQFSASSKYDNLFIEVEVLNANYDSWRQVRYGQLDLAGENILFENVPTGSVTARLRYPKYHNGHNVWPILLEVTV